MKYLKRGGGPRRRVGGLVGDARVPQQHLTSHVLELNETTNYYLNKFNKLLFCS